MAHPKERGGAGYRSPCLSHAKRALYRLSYTPRHEGSRLTENGAETVVAHTATRRSAKRKRIPQSVGLEPTLPEGN